MTKFLLRSLFLATFLPIAAGAEDITTLSGKRYLDVHDVMIRDNLLTFSTADNIVRIPLKDIPANLKTRYAPKATPPPAGPAEPVENTTAPTGEATKPAEGGEPKTPHDLVLNIANKYIRQIGDDMKTVASTKPVTITSGNAFAANKIDDARKLAMSEGKAVAFFLLDQSLLDVPADPNKADAAGALAQFFQTFNRSMTIVFVMMPRDQANLPPAVTEMLKKPASVPIPRVVITNAEVTAPIYVMELPSAQASMADREKLVYPAVVALKRWYIDIANSTH